jgi:hypothetical protein
MPFKLNHILIQASDARYRNQGPGMWNQMPGTRIEIPVARDRNWLSETRFQISGTNRQIHFHSHMVQENQKRIIFV